MATPTEQALQGFGDKWGYETHGCRGAPKRTTFRGAQSDQGSATILSQHQCSSTPGASTTNGGKSPEGRGMGTRSVGRGK
ncbi:hypothetical protein SI65_07340 [Aspergillus cristatus]|uniref:Uncharacterized protein n=1 Tax=Aspergillus cristatus TaxID=573508 RepID=A0A1E3B7J5_ASPCR|nr:hypothetical protein SI65_07340 [Aspergillus cristatus]